MIFDENKSIYENQSLFEKITVIRDGFNICPMFPHIHLLITIIPIILSFIQWYQIVVVL